MQTAPRAGTIGTDDLDVSGTHPGLLRLIAGMGPDPAEDARASKLRVGRLVRGRARI